MFRDKRLIISEGDFAAIEEQLANNNQANLEVTGMSMWPFLCHGKDRVIVESVNPENIKVGDIILFKVSKDNYMLQRVTQRGAEWFKTTGDGNFDSDGSYSVNRIVAKTGKVIRDGKVIDCEDFRWKILSGIWMMLFPVRKYIFAIWFGIRNFADF